MQWVFLVLALSAALAELHTGTFYLAGVALVAFATFVTGFWLPDDPLIYIFAVGCVLAVVIVWLWRKTLPQDSGLADFDTGGEAMVAAISRDPTRLTVTYRGTRWDAVLESGPPPEIGSLLQITGKTGSVLHVAAPPHQRPVQEAS